MGPCVQRVTEGHDQTVQTDLVSTHPLVTELKLVESCIFTYSKGTYKSITELPSHSCQATFIYIALYTIQIVS